MSWLDIFLWAVLPYICLTTLVVGTIIRRIYFARTWSAKSSEFLERKKERAGVPLFHVALLFVLGGHMMGLFIPKAITNAWGLSEHTYHKIALYVGVVVGTLLTVAFVILCVRRFGRNKRLRVNTSRIDKVLYCLLAVVIVFGMISTLSNAGGGFVYRDTLAPWARGILMGHPDPSLMAPTPLVYKIHIVCAFLFFALLPFTRIVHMFSGVTAILKSPLRKPIVYRAHPQKQGPAPRGADAGGTTAVGVSAPERDLEFNQGLR